MSGEERETTKKKTKRNVKIRRQRCETLGDESTNMVRSKWTDMLIIAFSTCLDAFRSMKRTIRCHVAQRYAADLNCKRTHQADAGAVWRPTAYIRFPRWPQQSCRWHENNRSEPAHRKQIVDLCEESLLWPTAPDKSTPNIWWNEATISLLSFKPINNWASNGRPLTKNQSPTHSSDKR